MSSKGSSWLAANPSKRWTEVFFLSYSPFWILWALCILVPFQLYEHLDENGYLLVGLAAAVPCFLLPLLLPNKADEGKPWHQWFWVKAHVWIAIFGYIGNYFWTHYFFNLLGAAYTLPSYKLNGVPIPMYLMTHAYFCLYHAVSNVLLRRVESHLSHAPLQTRKVARGLAVFLLSYATAYMETLTISHVRHIQLKHLLAIRHTCFAQYRSLHDISRHWQPLRQSVKHETALLGSAMHSVPVLHLY
eukprot:GHRR01036776.1.p1 GENE.GHRR01036776.1~~GHRR01036776.1.p1  ORF type:complete len:245 (+),score=51.51 GHRR01036776.1:384-1118(+)